LRCVLAVAEEGTFSRAAERLGITQPAVSMSIRNLEKDLGVTLFDRSPGRCSLTPEGERLLELVGEVLRSEERLFQAARELLGEPRGVVEAAASNIPGEYLLPRLIRGFRALFPRVDVRVLVTDSREVLRLLKEGASELGFTGEEPRGAGWAIHPIAPDRLVLVAPPDHPLAGKRLKGADRLREEEFILREAGSGTRSLMLRALEEAGIGPRELKVAAELGSTGSVIEAVQEGAGLSMVSTWAALEHLTAGRLSLVEMSGLVARRDFLAVHRRDRRLSRPALSLLEHAVKSRAELERELQREVREIMPPRRSGKRR